MNNIEELVARLRGAETTLGESLCFGLVGEAADTIEALRKQVGDWKVECGHAEALAAKIGLTITICTRDFWRR